MQNVRWFQLPNVLDLMLFFVIDDVKLNIFNFLKASEAKLDT